MKVLITGITGMIGSHLADYLLTHGNVEVFGFKRWRSNPKNILHLEGKVTFIEGDIEDSSSIERAIKESNPDKIYHLAAQSYPRESWDAPVATFNANVIGTINLLEAVRKHCPDSWVHIACSSAQYGFIRPEDVPITENQPMKPLSPYGVSKVAQELLGYQYFANFGLNTVMTRSFNHVGPRQGDRCSVQTFSKQLAEIEAGLHEPVLYVGNLTPRRDFSDVRDIVRALWLLLEKGKAGETYNMSSGMAPTIQEVLDTVLSYSKTTVEVKVDPARLRPSDEPILLGDNTKLREATGWNPEIPFKQTVLDIVNYWREETTRRD